MLSKEAGYETVVRGYISVLAGMLLRYVPRSNGSSRKDIRDKSISKVQSAINYIEENYARDISLEEVSEHLGISTFYFSRIFSSLTGVTYRSYLNSIRVEKADSLLCSTDKKIIDIAYECGFNSLRTFNRVYHTVKGVAPSDIRRSL
jgi:AraC-like DNA-binding protein